MKKHVFFLLVAITFSQMLFSQGKNTGNVNQYRFDKKAAYEEAKLKGLNDSEINGYVQFLKNDFSSKKALESQVHKHTPYELTPTDISETVIYLEPNKPMSLGCPNMGFEQYNFSGWTGGKGTVSTGPTGGNPNYTSTGTTIINTAGSNVSVANTVNYHTIMSLPPVNPDYSSIDGYDSLACKIVGTQTISEIPFKSPYSFDPVSVRMNSMNSNYRACRLKYITTSTSTNQRLSFSYAVIFQNPSTPVHLIQEAPYFKVQVRNEATGAIIQGCTSYTFNPKSSSPSDSLKQSVIDDGINPTFYRKWNYYSVDLSNLPPGTNVSVNFEVGGCTQGGHWGYAYVDAECGGIGTPYANMCSGSTFATLVAPTGFSTYQWFGPGGIIAGATNDTLIENSATAGTTYTVNMVSPGGCPLSQTVNIGFTTVGIINLNTTSSCAGGNSGTAYVEASGSNGVYNYSWTATSGPNTGQIVSASQTATGLAAGSYSILVSSTTCGQASANLSVGVSPPSFFSQIKSFCGNATTIPMPGGSNYVWYKGSSVIPAPNGTNDTLLISSAIAGDVYTVVYKNSQGCKDSIKYTLKSTVGGNSYFSNTTNVCPNDANGATILNLNTPYSAPYNYLVTGPSSSQVVISTSTNSNSLSLSSLSAGTYTAVIYDGTCIYNNTVSIGVIETNFSVTATNSVLCFPQEAVINIKHDPVTPLSCGVDPSLCSGPATQLFSTATFTQNGSTSFPTPYGNYYTNGRTQFLIQKSDLNAAGIFGGKLSSLAFNVLNFNTGETTYPDFSIKMGCTNLVELPNANVIDQSFVTGLQTVYSATNQTITLGWVTHDFSQSYLWDGISNVIVEVCFSFPGTFNYSNNISVQLKQMSYIANMYHVDDTNPVCSGTQPADNGVGSSITNGINMLPNMKFGYCPYYLPSSNYTTTISSNGSITATYSGDSIKIAPTFTAVPLLSGSAIYSISVTNPIGGCIATQTVEIIYPPLTTNITTASTNTLLCEGESTNLLATGAATYNWYYQQGQSGPLLPISSSSSISVTPPSAGTNTYVVTGSALCPGSTLDTKIITINVTPKTNLIITPLQDVTKCLNKSFVLNTAVGSTLPENLGTPYSYTWTTLPTNTIAPNATNSPSYTINSNSTTTLVITVSGVCANSTSDTVIVTNFIDDLSVSIIDSASICANTPFTLNAIANGGYPNYNYGWSIIPNTTIISNSSTLNFNSPEIEGTYTVAVYINDSCGYTKTDYQVINVLPPCTVIIPNIITANGDGINDFFKIKNLEFNPNTSLTIFDRWGLKVYENTNYNNEWNGSDVSDGTFFYIIDVPGDKKYSGFVTVFKGK